MKLDFGYLNIQFLGTLWKSFFISQHWHYIRTVIIILQFFHQLGYLTKIKVKFKRLLLRRIIIHLCTHMAFGFSINNSIFYNLQSTLSFLERKLILSSLQWLKTNHCRQLLKIFSSKVEYELRWCLWVSICEQLKTMIQTEWILHEFVCLDHLRPLP